MKSYCNSCKRETNHEVIKEKVEIDTDDNEGVFEEAKYQIIQCKGCDRSSFREERWYSEDINPYTGEPIKTIKIHPPKPLISSKKLLVKEIIGVPYKIKGIYKETISSYNNDNYILCGIGLRAIIEGICEDKGIKGGIVTLNKGDKYEKDIYKNNLEGKIEGLYQKEFLSNNHATILHNHRFIGNEAAHELVSSEEELKVAITIIEHTLENIYELKYKVEELELQRKLKNKK